MLSNNSREKGKFGGFDSSHYLATFVVKLTKEVGSKWDRSGIVAGLHLGRAGENCRKSMIIRLLSYLALILDTSGKICQAENQENKVLSAKIFLEGN